MNKIVGKIIQSTLSIPIFQKQLLYQINFYNISKNEIYIHFYSKIKILLSRIFTSVSFTMNVRYWNMIFKMNQNVKGIPSEDPKMLSETCYGFEIQNHSHAF